MDTKYDMLLDWLWDIMELTDNPGIHDLHRCLITGDWNWPDNMGVGA